MERLYADVEYCGITYCDAEQIDNIWYYEDGFGRIQAFFRQEWVQPITHLSETRHHTLCLLGYAVAERVAGETAHRVPRP